MAPHCHHYDPGSRRVILQYSPGTALLMAAFSRGTEGQRTLAATAGLVLLAAIAAVLVHGASWRCLAIVASLLAVTLRLLRDHAAYASFSVPWSVGLLAVATLAAVRLPGLHGAGAGATGALLGAASGLLLLVRIANLFPVAGLGLFLLLRRGPHPRNRAAPVLAAAACLLTGPLGLALAN